jgi:uncharacterized protein involved in exopolysaccharide biosynthesis
VTAAAPDDWFAFGDRVSRDLVRHWRVAVAAALLGAVAGGVTALLLPSYFRSGTAFQAESVPAPQISGALAGLASQIGGLNVATQNNAQLFADLLTTDAVLRRVAAASFPWHAGTASLPVIYGYDQEPAGWREYRTVHKLRKQLRVDVNIRTGVVRFSIEARTPALAEALAESTLTALNEANITLRQARAAAERTFTSQRAADAQQELAQAEGALQKFYERNRTITNAPSLQIEEARLRRAVDMAQQVYVQLRLQEEQASVQAVRNTPSISVIDPPLLPVKRSWPQRRLAVLLGGLIGLGLAFARYALRPAHRGAVG